MAQGATTFMYGRQHFAIVEDPTVDAVELKSSAAVCKCTALVKSLGRNICRKRLAAAYVLRMVGVQPYVPELRRAPRRKISSGTPIVWSMGDNSAA